MINFPNYKLLIILLLMSTPFQIFLRKQHEQRNKRQSKSTSRMNRTLDPGSWGKQINCSSTAKSKVKSLIAEETSEENEKYQIILRKAIKKISASRYKTNRDYATKFQTSEPYIQQSSTQLSPRKLHSARYASKQTKNDEDKKQKNKRIYHKQLYPNKAEIIYPIEMPVDFLNYQPRFPEKKILREAAIKKQKKYDFYEAGTNSKGLSLPPKQRKQKQSLGKVKYCNTKRLQRIIQENTPTIQAWDFMKEDDDNLQF